jgi:hypothetical protein
MIHLADILSGLVMGFFVAEIFWRYPFIINRRFVLLDQLARLARVDKMCGDLCRELYLDLPLGAWERKIEKWRSENL